MHDEPYEKGLDGAGAAPGAAEEAWAARRHEVEFADRCAARGPRPRLDVEGEDPWRGKVSLRWVPIHVIEECARRNGRADLLRERIDGAVGM
ncbi:DUF664 domain-containing protein [Streptomyces sp. NPDC001389]|uniref:mycothiol transferase n=1 Tax=unclassified Streptomyces TaxID=2593676 RepID=UPI0036A18582